MVILIGGASCTGKTKMAQKLLETYKIPYFSIDHLKMGLVRGTDNCGFTPTDTEKKITEKLWPIVKAIIMTNIENNQSIIIEGCYFPPDKLKDFEYQYLEKIISVFIGFSENYISKYFEKNIIAHACDIESRGKNNRTADWFVSANKAAKKACVENDIKYFEINENYDKEMQKVYKWIEESNQAITRYAKANSYNSLRTQVLNLKPRDIGIKLDNNRQVYAAVVDMPTSENNITTLMCTFAGTVSLCYQNGGRELGLGQKSEKIKQAGTSFLFSAGQMVQHMKRTTDFSVPKGKESYVFLLTRDNVFRTEFDMKNINNYDINIELLNSLIQNVLNKIKEVR